MTRSPSLDFGAALWADCLVVCGVVYGQHALRTMVWIDLRGFGLNYKMHFFESI